MARCLAARDLLAEQLHMHIYARQAVASEVRPVSGVRLNSYFNKFVRCLQLMLQPQQQPAGVVDECKGGSTYSTLHRYGWGSLPGHNCLFATVPPLPLNRDVAVVRNFVTSYCIVLWCSDTKTAEPAQAERDKARSEVISPVPTSLHVAYTT